MEEDKQEGLELPKIIQPRVSKCRVQTEVRRFVFENLLLFRLLTRWLILPHGYLNSVQLLEAK
jgi:hypothetical protein